MGQVLSLSDAAADMYLYGNKSNIIQNLLHNQLARIQPAYNEFSNRIQAALQNSYNFINDRMIQYGILNQIQQSGLQAVDNYYMECLTFSNLQQANFTMQRWIMSHPEVRNLYLQQNIDGYSNTYKNVFGNEVGEADYNYRRVMDEVLVSNDDDVWQVKYYSEDLLEGDKELNHYEKKQILHTYDAMDWLLSNCKWDFTNTSETPVKINRED